MMTMKRMKMVIKIWLITATKMMRTLIIMIKVMLITMTIKCRGTWNAAHVTMLD